MNNKNLSNYEAMRSLGENSLKKFNAGWQYTFIGDAIDKICVSEAESIFLHSEGFHVDSNSKTKIYFTEGYCMSSIERIDGKIYTPRDLGYFLIQHRYGITAL